MIETPDVSAMPTWLNRDEFEQLITKLSLVDRELWCRYGSTLENHPL